MYTDWAPGTSITRHCARLLVSDGVGGRCGDVPRDKLPSFSLMFDERGQGPENFLEPIFLEIVPARAILMSMASAGICFLSRAQEDI